MLKKLIKIFLLIVYLFVIAALVVSAVQNLETRTFALITVCILVATLPGFLIIRKAIIRKREKSFIERVITADKKKIENSSGSLKPELLALQQSWKEAINRLCDSRLRRYGNPLYALPWYIVAGESGIGKSSMIRHSGLLSPLAPEISSNTLSVTRNCDWWFFNEAVILDTAGRYTIPIDAQRDTPEWDEFLKLLTRFRRKEPVNGIVAVISAEKLLKSSPEELVEQGALVRSRIDQVMRSLSNSFPVYVMVTKMDLVFGMPEFFRALPRSRLGQAMGWCNDSHLPCSGPLVETAMNSIGNNLRILRSRLLHKSETPEAEVLIFPNKFQELLPGLRTFCTSLFSDNIYRVTPQFRGIYFSSALQKIEQGSAEEDERDLSGRIPGGGMFLREFFSKVLPGDRRLFRFIPEYAVRNLLDHNLFRSVWITIFLLLIMFTWSGYRRNHEIIKTLETVSGSAADTGSIDYLESVRLSVHRLQERNSRIMPFRMGMSQSVAVEKHLRNHYIRTFERNMHSRICGLITASIDQISPEIPEDSVTAALEYLTSLLGLIDGFDTKDRNFNEYRNAAGGYLPTVLPWMTNNETRKVIYQYCDWIDWSDRISAGKFRQFIYDNLTTLLKKKGSTFRWCVKYPVHGVNSVTMRDFWGQAAAAPLFTTGNLARVQTDRLSVRQSPSADAAKICFVDSDGMFPVDSAHSSWIRIKTPDGARGWIASEYAVIHSKSDTVQINGAFTIDGFSRIQTFLDHIYSRIYDAGLKNTFAFQRDAFYRWYWENYYDQWYAVMDRFIDGFSKGTSPDILRLYMKSIGTNNDPFSRFIRKAASELDSANTVYLDPAWRDQVLLLRDTERASKEKADDSAATGLAKTGKTVSGLFKKVGKQTKEFVNQNEMVRNRRIESSMSCLSDYQSALAAIYEGALKPGGTLRFARLLFSPQDSGSENYFSALDAKRELKSNLFRDKADDALWRFVEGPLTILKNVAYSEANAEVQRLWETKILAHLDPADPEEQVDYLFAADSGLVHSFLDDSYVSAFLQTASDGNIRPVDGSDGPLGFTGEFIGFINKGLRYSVKSEYPLSLQTVPFSVNPDAAEEPYQTILRLQCAGGAAVLENFNHFETADFNYQPSSCGEVTLRVVFPSFTAVRTWPGRWGFPNFLTTFRDGVNVIRADDFDKQYLARMQRKNIKWVKVSYVLDPFTAEEITGILRNIPRNIPVRIVAGL